jgi:N6-adenosine-specific RNA methylase IME4
MPVIMEELKSLIPALAPDELAGLESSIKEEGCREALIIWKGRDVVVDGHNRFKICIQNNTPFKTMEKEFADINEVKLWIINNQLARRNLTDGCKFELTLKKKALLLEIGRNKQKEAGIAGRKKQLGVLSDVDKSPEHDTRNILASDLGWSTGKLAMAEKVWNKADEETKQAIRENRKTINEVYLNIHREERLDKIRQQQAALNRQALEKPSGQFDVIVVDPPWRYDGDKFQANPGNLPSYARNGHQGTAVYPTMSLDEIKAIRLPAKKDCVLWLWTTNLFLPDCYPILEAWGFELKTMLTWDKEHIGTGAWLRSQTEHCLLAVKGHPVYHNTKYSTLLREARAGPHSTKPESFYKLVEETCAGRKLDYFARKKREGWEVYGDEVEGGAK